MLSRKQCLSFGVIGIMKGNPHRSHLFLERIRNWIRIAIEIYVEGVYQTAARSWDIKLRISQVRPFVPALYLCADLKALW